MSYIFYSRLNATSSKSVAFNLGKVHLLLNFTHVFAPLHPTIHKRLILRIVEIRKTEQTRVKGKTNK